MSQLSLKKIKLGDSADTSKNFLISVPTIPDGTLTIERENGTDVLTVDAAGKVTFPGNVVPAFSAYQSVVQTLPANSFAKINLQSEEFDTTNAFDNVTNYRFQPSVAGYYQINGRIGVGAANIQTHCAIYKGGSSFKFGTMNAGASFGSDSTVSAQIYLNGTTDYLELWGKTLSSQNLSTTSIETFFQGYLVRAA